VLCIKQKLLIGRRDDLTQKHEDAALLRADIERRCQPVMLTLGTVLSQTQLTDVEYQRMMRMQLAVEMQDVDSAAALADRQLSVLRVLVNGSAEGEK